VGDSEADRITSDVILASAAVPSIFRAVHIGRHVYWDGLFSQNPPVRELPDAVRTADGAPPDEIWIIQINPSHRDGEPQAMVEIRDRRNELAGNISLDQEVFFIGQMNKLVLDRQPVEDAKYRPLKVRCVRMANRGRLRPRLRVEVATQPRVPRGADQARSRAWTALSRRPDVAERRRGDGVLVTGHLGSLGTIDGDARRVATPEHRGRIQAQEAGGETPLERLTDRRARRGLSARSVAGVAGEHEQAVRG
jgi:hypothetical protein